MMHTINILCIFELVWLFFYEIYVSWIKYNVKDFLCGYLLINGLYLGMNNIRRKIVESLLVLVYIIKDCLLNLPNLVFREYILEFFILFFKIRIF